MGGRSDGHGPVGHPRGGMGGRANGHRMAGWGSPPPNPAPGVSVPRSLSLSYTHAHPRTRTIAVDGGWGDCHKSEVRTDSVFRRR
jgi:hypothetical protein